jgi:hypothetical protein
MRTHLNQWLDRFLDPHQTHGPEWRWAVLTVIYGAIGSAIGFTPGILIVTWFCKCQCD